MVYDVENQTYQGTSIIHQRKGTVYNVSSQSVQLSFPQEILCDTLFLMAICSDIQNISVTRPITDVKTLKWLSRNVYS